MLSRLDYISIDVRQKPENFLGNFHYLRDVVVTPSAIVKSQSPIWNHIRSSYQSSVLCDHLYE